MTQIEPWSKRLTTVIAGQITRFRTERKMSAQQLADATGTLQHPIARSVIANLESGRRDAVSVAELLVLARALDVAPLLLVFPVGHDPVVEPLPNVVVNTWRAAKWFTGEAPLPLGAPGAEWEDRQRWEDSPLALFRDHEKLTGRWIRANSSMARASTDQERDLAHEARTSIAEQIHRHRTLIRREGFEPPELPAPLLDEVEEQADGQR